MIYIVIRCSSEIIPTQIPIWRSGIFDKEKRELSLLFNGGSNDYMNCFGRQTISINRIFHFKHFCITIADIPKNITCLRYCIRVVQDKGGKLKFECSILKIVLCVKKINIQHIVLELKKWLGDGAERNRTAVPPSRMIMVSGNIHRNYRVRIKSKAWHIR